MRRVGEAAFSKVEKINSELFSLTYGAIVTQLLKDYEEVDATNTQLEKMGYNIGVRLIDEFLAKAQVGNCGNFGETAEVIAKVGFKMFLGITAEVVGVSEKEFSLQLPENPLAEFVELPEQYGSLAYNNMLCGVLRGALEMVQMRVECSLTKDALWGDEVTEIRVVLKEMMEEEYVDDD
ncbi:trafficking protein particle complex subunit 3 [Chrysochromulina tobinii]|uniref:Trafficking protein particle complex subunit n=1 Tax=Chrysochromulina tobinii TaxID=1460289 RepID=A0A0M0JZX8_9EUKA|nr:trafficking protein particle complex subunit 3 [Chrysochromulina tobinii]|eukprot:KOO32201.1 trafficking protein particle complex subunit 3 [Chrysochromulina sp. CCMP291]